MEEWAVKEGEGKWEEGEGKEKEGGSGEIDSGRENRDGEVIRVDI